MKKKIFREKHSIEEQVEEMLEITPTEKEKKETKKDGNRKSKSDKSAK